MTRRIPRPSPEMTMACLALVVALGGTGVAAIQLVPRASVGTVQLRNDAVISSKARNGSLRAVDVAAGQAPAGPAGRKGDKGGKGEQGAPGDRGALGPSDAYTRSVVGPVTIDSGSTFTRVASLDLPQAGTYVIWAKTNVVVPGSDEDWVLCELRAGGGNVDSTLAFVPYVGTTLAAHLVADVAAPGEIAFSCSVTQGALATRARITAVKVATLTG